MNTSPQLGESFSQEPRPIDELTRLPGEAALLAHVDDLIQVGNPNGLGILYVDVDGFKNINELFGHQETGNVVLVALARSLSVIHRGEDYIASRLHGDEFAAQIHMLRPEARFRQAYHGESVSSNSEKFGDLFAALQNRWTQKLSETFNGELAKALQEADLRGIKEQGGKVDAITRSQAMRRAQKKVTEIYEKIPRLGISVGGALWEQGDTAAILLSKADHAMQAAKDERKAAYLRSLPRRKRAALKVSRLLRSYATGEDPDRF